MKVISERNDDHLAAKEKSLQEDIQKALAKQEELLKIEAE